MRSRLNSASQYNSSLNFSHTDTSHVRVKTVHQNWELKFVSSSHGHWLPCDHPVVKDDLQIVEAFLDAILLSSKFMFLPFGNFSSHVMVTLTTSYLWRKHLAKTGITASNFGTLSFSLFSEICCPVACPGPDLVNTSLFSQPPHFRRDYPLPIQTHWFHLLPPSKLSHILF